MTNQNNRRPNESGAASNAHNRRVQSVSKADTDRRAPIKREGVMSDLRVALKATASHIAVVGSGGDATAAFLGFSVNDETSFGADEIDPSLIQLERFAITKIIDKAYDFAFQVGHRPHRHAMTDVEYLRMLTFRRSSPLFVWGGVRTPMDDDEAPICRTIDTADARMRLLWEFDPTIRQLALLANMSEPAVRTSLSKEGIRTVEAGGEEIPVEDAQYWNGGETLRRAISIDDARRWLAGRRGFVSTLVPEPSDPFYTDDIVRLFKAHGFGAGIEAHVSGESLSEVARATKTDPDWLLELASGRPTKLDMEALIRVANHLSADAPAFIGRAVENILRVNTEVGTGA